MSRQSIIKLNTTLLRAKEGGGFLLFCFRFVLFYFFACFKYHPP